MSEYVGCPRNAAEIKLSALPLTVLIFYAYAVIKNPERCNLIIMGWDRSRTSYWTDDQHAEQAWKEEELGERILKTAGYGGLYKRHSIVLAQVEMAIFKFLNSPNENFEEFVLKETQSSPFVKGNA